jgi:uncharacterized protein
MPTNDPSKPIDSALSIALCLRAQADGVWLRVKLQPRAATNQIVGPVGQELRVRITAPPVDAAANRALIEFLARQLDCPRRQIELVRGHTSRHKVLRIAGLPLERVIERIQKAVNSPNRSGRPSAGI